jgi:hypothetical protein
VGVASFFRFFFSFVLRLLCGGVVKGGGKWWEVDKSGKEWLGVECSWVAHACSGAKRG